VQLITCEQESKHADARRCVQKLAGEQRGVTGDRGSGATAIRFKLRTEGPTS